MRTSGYLCGLLLTLCSFAPKASADRSVRRLLRANPSLGLLLSRLDRVTLELQGCDHFGEHDRETCRKRMDWIHAHKALEPVGRHRGKREHLYCVDYNRPIVRDRHKGKNRFQPVSGFKCWGSRDYDDGFPSESFWTLEFLCLPLGTQNVQPPGSCTLHYSQGNEDEDSDYYYSFITEREGKKLAIRDDQVRFSFRESN